MTANCLGVACCQQKEVQRPIYSIHFRQLSQDGVNHSLELPIPYYWWWKKLKWLTSADSYLLDVYKFWQQNMPQKPTLYTPSPVTAVNKKCPFTNRWKIFFTKSFKISVCFWANLKQNTKQINGYFLVENMSVFVQKGICVYEVENKWMRTPCFVGNSIYCLCSAWVRATCTIPDYSVSEEKQFIFMEIFWLSWKLVLGNCLRRREVKDRH